MYDYIIVGAGSSGCALANRLSEDPNTKVCLIEAGPEDTNPMIHMPAGFITYGPKKGKYNWGFETEPQDGLNGRKGYQPRGKGLGGSSNLTAMVYIRGHKWDYDNWESLGNKGWGYKDVLPYFIKSENQERGKDLYHGEGGPLHVSDLRSVSPLTRAFVKASEEVNIPVNNDFNGPDQEGAGVYQVTQVNGERCSSAKAYLTPIKDRPNLTIMTNTYAKSVILENGVAKGMKVDVKGEEKEILARNEVVLSAGAFQSPQLLMLSGVGDKKELESKGITVHKDLPGVGKNLQDHLDFILLYGTKSTDTMGVSVRGVLKVLKGIYQYVTKRTGILTSNYAEGGAFLKTSPNLSIPDIQLHFVKARVIDHARQLSLKHGYSCHVCQLRPESKGSVTIKSSDPYDAPIIDPAFLKDPKDVDVMLRAVKKTREIMNAKAFDKFRLKELFTANAKTDKEIIEVIRNRADTIYHPVGTCKMGPVNDPMSVVDEKLQVKGIKGLRVVDCSIMPTLIGGNTNAPAIMIAEKAADMIKASHNRTVAPNNKPSGSPPTLS